MKKEKILTNLSIYSFWHRANGDIVPIYNSVGVERVIETDESATIHFTMRPAAMEFVANMREGYVEVRYSTHQPDNPFHGEMLLIARNIKPYHMTLDNVDPLEVGAKELHFRVRAHCDLEWGIMKSPIEKEVVTDVED